jgi:hypothetical protein
MGPASSKNGSSFAPTIGTNDEDNLYVVPLPALVR